MKPEIEKQAVAELFIAGPSTTLADCPIGLFVAGDQLCLKTEYGDNNGRIDAYIVSSGEFFWGGASTPLEQRKVIVTPATLSASHISAVPRIVAPTEQEEVKEPLCVNCKNCIKPHGLTPPSDIAFRCRLEPYGTSIVTGAVRYSKCEDVRDSETGKCGPQGKLFEEFI